jgi:hypothetical protein
MLAREIENHILSLVEKPRRLETEPVEGLA